MITIVSSLLGIGIWALGVILILVIKVLILIASYQNFIDSQAVVLGWVIVRDICNMFFVVVLLIIAFGTILHLEDYNYKKWLPKLILMAILINFSKTICGLLIDASQIVMLTFVNAFKDIGGASMTQILGLDKIVTLAKEDTSGVTLWTVVAAYGLGIIYLLVSIVVIVTMMMMLVMRLVMIWLYVVLSPLAYLLSAFPGGQKYASQWWDEFIKNLMVGPVLAFFIWLSFASLQAVNRDTVVVSEQEEQQMQKSLSTMGDTSAKASSSATNIAATQASSPGSLINFVIAIGMLLGGLKVSRDIGGEAGSLAGKGMAKIQAGAAFAGRTATGAALLPLKGLKMAAGTATSYGVEKLHEKTGVDLNLKRVWAGVQEKRKEKSEKRYTTGQQAAREAMESGGRLHGIMAMTGNSGDAWEQMSSWKGVGKRLRGGRMMVRRQEEGVQEKQAANLEVETRKHELDYMQADPIKRDEMRRKAADEKKNALDVVRNEDSNINNLDKEIAKERNRDPRLVDKGNIAKLEEKKRESLQRQEEAKVKAQGLQEQQKFMNSNYSKSFSARELANKEVALKQAERTSEKAEQKIESNIPEYSFEARAAEQKAVSAESAKIKDITDPSELLRIMKDAISAHDKTMVKAIALKMTKEGNDNEYLQPLAGRTDHVGLKDLMRQFSDKNSKNYAGFSQQEAFGLGSQIAEKNKDTNHWAASSAYLMEGGKWRETTDKEHHEIRDVETGKQQLQSFIRNNNRLAYGYHENDKDGTFHLDVGGILKLRGLNNESGHKNIETMNESAAKYIYDAIKKNPKLMQEFSIPMGKDGKTLISSLEARLGVLKDSNSFEDKYSEASDLGTA